MISKVIEVMKVLPLSLYEIEVSSYKLLNFFIISSCYYNNFKHKKRKLVYNVVLFNTNELNDCIFFT